MQRLQVFVILLVRVKTVSEQDIALLMEELKVTIPDSRDAISEGKDHVHS